MAAVVALGAASLAVTASADAAWKLERSFEVEGLINIDVTPAGNVFALYDVPSEKGVRHYTSKGRLVGSWNPEFNNTALGIADDPVSGNVLISDLGGAFTDPRVLTYTASGRLVDAGPVVAPEGAPAQVQAIDVDGRGDRYLAYFTIADPENVHGVLRLDAAGRRLAAWGGPSGAGTGQLDATSDVASDGRGHVYVVEAGNDRVQRFTDAGAFVGAWGRFGSEPGQFIDPVSVSTDPGGNVWVADSQAGSATRVQRFRPDGTLVEAVTTPRDVGDALAVAFDDSGKLYVATGGSGFLRGNVYVYRDVGRSAPKIRAKPLRLKRGRIQVRVACPTGAACAGGLLIRHKNTKLAKGTYRVRAGRSRSATAKLTARGEKLLRARARTRKLTVELRPKGGGETITKKLRLQR